MRITLRYRALDALGGWTSAHHPKRGRRPHVAEAVRPSLEHSRPPHLWCLTTEQAPNHRLAVPGMS